MAGHPRRTLRGLVSVPHSRRGKQETNMRSKRQAQALARTADTLREQFLPSSRWLQQSCLWRCCTDFPACLCTPGTHPRRAHNRQPHSRRKAALGGRLVDGGRAGAKVQPAERLTDAYRPKLARWHKIGLLHHSYWRQCVKCDFSHSGRSASVSSLLTSLSD